MSRAMRNNRKKESRFKGLIWIIPVVIIILIAGYTFGGTYYASRFESNTKINGIDVSGLSAKDAKSALDKHYETQTFILTENGQEWKSIPFTDLGVSADYSDKLNTELKKQNQWAWGLALFSSSDLKMDVLSLNEEKLQGALSGLIEEINQLNEGRTQTQDATLIKSDTGFAIQPEVEGNNINTEAVIEAISKTISEGDHTLELENFLKKPAVTSEDSNLKEKEASLNRIAQIQANYSINGNTFQIPTTTIMDWLVYENGEVNLDNDKITAYVTELGTNYNTSTNPTAFNSTLRGQVSVPAGVYGWSIQTDLEVAALKEALMAGEPFTRVPITQGATEADHPLVGSTYIEVDLANQHMWYYQDGGLVLETDIVSGRPSMATVPGVHYVWSKESPSTLRGTNEDGSKYETPVSYWMPIDWSGIGIHDSNWQPAYGGSLYLNGAGSHGCINTPPSVAGQLFNLVAVGTPVLVF